MSAAPVVRATRVRVFVDYWNFQLALNRREADELGVPDCRFKVDWSALGPWLARVACETAQITPYTFDGLNIYTSFDPRNEDGKKFHNWVRTWLDKQPGVLVECRERKPKHPSKCPACHVEIITCPHCNQTMRPSVEKGVDTLIATDMIRLAWEDGYDVAVLATMDRDLIPAVDFLSQKAKKVIQAGFPPKGIDLANSCWASFDVGKRRGEIARA